MLKYIREISLSVLVVATSCATIKAGSSYEAARERFKGRLCTLQDGLMSNGDYLQFIEPHLQRAERDLVIPKHLQTKRTINDNDENYMAELARCNVALFHRYANPKNPQAEIGYQRCQRNLTRAIQSIQDNDNVKVDAHSEFRNTANLLTAANEEFYKKLNFASRALLYFALIWYSELCRCYA